MEITLVQLKQITNLSEAKLTPFIDQINTGFKTYSITTKLRACHFLAQVLHESGAFRYLEEIASGDAYDTRVDLGNTPEKDGDGRLFKGRGLIQITGKTNYKLISEDLKYDFVKDPEALKSIKWATLSAFWYWNRKKLNLFADKDDILTITEKINGGINGLADRQLWLAKCKKYITE